MSARRIWGCKLMKLKFALIAVLLSVLVIAASAAETLRVIPPQNVKYNTVEVVRGTLSRTGDFAAELSFPHTLAVTIPKNCKFKDGVFSGQYVNEGDVIASFTVDDNSLAVEEARLAYELEQLRYNAANSDYERYIAKLGVDAAKSALDALKFQGEDFEIYAPQSGWVTSVQHYGGSSYTAGQLYCLLYVPDVVQLKVIADAERVALLKYSASVTIHPIKGEDVYFSAHILTNTTLIDLPGITPCAIAEFDNPEEFQAYAEKNPAAVNDTKYQLSIELTDIKDVLLCPQKAIQKENTYRYVNIFEDGMSKKRYVLTGLTSGDYVQILDGLNEGDEVIII